MSVYVEATAMPLVLEFPDDPIETVRDLIARWVSTGYVASMVLPEGFTVIVNFGRLPAVAVSPYEPTAVRDEHPPPVVRTSVADSHRTGRE